MLTRDEATTRVARGAAHLDAVRPGWFTRIDVGMLTLHDPCGCIIGQLCGANLGTFTTHRVALGIPNSADYGFDLTFGELAGGETATQKFQPLQDAWVSAIADRVLAAAQASRTPIVADACCSPTSVAMTVRKRDGSSSGSLFSFYGLRTP